MKYLYVVILLPVLYTIAGCKKDRSPVPAPSTDSVYRVSMTKFYFIDQSYYTEQYSYDTLGMLTKATDRHPDGTLMSFQAYERNNGQLLAYHLHNNAAVKVATHACEYEGKSIRKITYTEFKPEPVLIFDRTLVYTNELPTFVTYTGALHYSTTLTWWQGNIIRIVTRNLPDNTLKEETLFEYDDKQNPYFDIGGIPDGNARYNSRNNITRVKTLEPDGAVKQAFALSYEYNAKGYPTTSFTTYPDGKKIQEQTFEYAFFPVQ